MSQHQARVGLSVKRLKQTALTWKVKDKATSQLARSDARLAVSGVNQMEQGETVLPRVLTGGTAVLTPPKVQTSESQCRVLLSWDIIKVISHFYNFEAVSVKFQFHQYMTSVGFREAGLHYKNLIKELVSFHFKTMIHAQLHTYIHTYILTYILRYMCVCMDTYMLEYY